MKPSSLFIGFLISGYILLSGCVYEKRHSHPSKETEVSEDNEQSDNVFNEEGKYRFEKRTVKLGKAEKAHLDISFPAGYIHVTGGAQELMEGKFKYRKEERQLELYDKMRDNGLIEVRLKFPKSGERDLHNEKNAASIALNDKVPMDLELGFGAGEGKFDLQNTNLKDAKFDLGAGDFEINLQNSHLTNLEVNAGVGKGKIDLSGEWKQNLNAEFNCGIGELKINLPSKVGVKVIVSGLLGDIRHYGLKKNGRTYTNKAYGESAHKLEIRISGGIGEVNLSMEDED